MPPMGAPSANYYVPTNAKPATSQGGFNFMSSVGANASSAFDDFLPSNFSSAARANMSLKVSDFC